MVTDVDNAINLIEHLAVDWGLAVEALSCLIGLMSLAGILTLLSLSPAIRKFLQAIVS